MVAVKLPLLAMINVSLFGHVAKALSVQTYQRCV